jgi:hypothetical protein
MPTKTRAESLTNMPSKRPPPGLVACFNCALPDSRIGRGCDDCGGAGYVTLQKRQQQRLRCGNTPQTPPTRRPVPLYHSDPLRDAQAEIEKLRTLISHELADRQKIAAEAAANERAAILALVEEALEAPDTMGALMRPHDDIKARETAGC